MPSINFEVSDDGSLALSKVTRILAGGELDVTLSLAVLDELLDLGDGLARHDHAGHALGARRGGDLDARQTVAVGRDGAQHRAAVEASMVWR